MLIIFAVDICRFELDFNNIRENPGACSACSDESVFSQYIMNSEVICNIDTILVFNYVTMVPAVDDTIFFVGKCYKI